jgi:hypothetical protein
MILLVESVKKLLFGSSVNHGYDLMSVLVLSAACIAKWGWLSKGKAWELNNAYENAHYVSTASHVEQNLDPDPRMDEADKVYVEQEDIDLAEKALAYFKELDPENNDYLLNITKIVKIGYVPYKYIGYACSMVSTYNREMEKKIKAEKKAKENADCPSSFQGVLNERLKGIRVVVTYKRYFENDFGSNTLYAFKDALGNVYKTFYSGSSWEAEVDEKLIIDGTVKKHNTFNGIEETMLNRVAVKSAPDEIFSVDEFKVA